MLEKTGDDAYKVAIKVKVGPMSMTYKGDVQIVERDDADEDRDAAREGEGVPRPGHRRRDVTWRSREEGDGTHASWTPTSRSAAASPRWAAA